MAAHAVPLARVSRIATRLKIFATLFIPLLPPFYRIRLLTALWRVLRSCRRTPAPGPRESAWRWMWVDEVAGGRKTVPLEVTPVRARGSLTVMQALVGAVYGLHLVEASPAIYVILPVGVARVDKVGASPGVHLVVAFAGDDLVVAAATPEVVVAAVALEVVLPAAAPEAVGPAETHEVVGPGGPQKRIVAGGAGEDLRQGLVPSEER